ncbi:MAG: hypothetical protein KBE41_05725 [Lutibacter sp.]|nr:hypothetical protein [Lutibacter sp.]MBP9600980.1 hypothetical protein [Lutibacter sp.]
MDKKSLDANFDILIKTTINHVAFYIPSAIFSKNSLTSIKGQIPDNFLDDLTILNVHLGFCVFEKQLFNDLIVKKPKLLENNIFLLLQLKKELDDFEFNYILKKYFEKVEFYTAIAEWLFLNLTKYNKKNIDTTTIGLFGIQSATYKTHFIELIDHFYQKTQIQLKDYYNLPELILVLIPDLLSRLELYGSDFTNLPPTEIQQPEISTENTKSTATTNTTVATVAVATVNQLKAKAKKKPLVSEKEAEEFLLSTVFNLSSEAIKKYCT